MVVFGLLLADVVACVDICGWELAICDGTSFFGVGVDREKALFFKIHAYASTHLYRRIG